MGHYRSNLADIEFALFDVFGRAEVLGTGPWTDLDLDTARSILHEVRHLAVTELAASYTSGDRTPPDLDPETGTVSLPEDFRAGFQAWMDAEFWRLGIPEGLGGQPSPPSLQWALSELVIGANPALFFYASGPRFASVAYLDGTPQQQRLGQMMIDRRWAATMVLTEPDAGSDVGTARTTATAQPDGTWHLKGVKRFITSGEHDLTENIVHFVLARPVGVEGAGGPGTKGLSLFMVPKFHVDLATGALGPRNGVRTTNLEHKMGLRVSTTCELSFGDGEPAVGYLLGDVHDGIRQMFEVIEYARMLVGTKSLATLSSAYLNALDYARQRIQGSDLTQQADKTAPRVPIIRHADVRRSLMTQKAYAEGLRALMLYTATLQDAVALGRAGGRDVTADRSLNDLLLPLVKGYSSEKAWTILGTESLQTFGGSGYLSDYPLEQYVRDAKVDTVYEGTTAIQGLDLFFRKIVRDRGQALTDLVRRVGAFLGADPGGAELAAERKLLAAALSDANGIVEQLVGLTMQSSAEPARLYRVGANTTRLLFAIGDVVIGWLLLWEASVALDQLATGTSVTGPIGDGSPEQALRVGKVAAARWFAREVLPHVAVARASVEGFDDMLTELPDDAF